MLIEMPMSNGSRCMISNKAIVALTESNTAGCTRVYAGVNMIEVKMIIDDVRKLIYKDFPEMLEGSKVDEPTNQAPEVKK